MKAKTLSLQLLLVATIAGFAASATAAMYKWTDKQGKVHYTQEPPPEGNAREMAPPPRVAAPASKNASTNDKDEAAGAQSEAGEPPLTPEQQEIYSRNCEAARGNLETYKTARRVQQSDGEVVVMDDAIRQKKMQQAEEQIKKFCK